MILAEKITEERKKNGWSQEEMAEKLSVSRQAVSKWESAQSTPDLQKVLRLAEIFGVSTDYLLKDELKSETGTEILEYAAEESSVRSVSMEEANAFMEWRRKTAPTLAGAVALCIISPALLIFLAGLSDSHIGNISENMATGAGISVLLLLVAAAVVIFVSYSIHGQQYEYLEKERIETAYGVTGLVQERKKDYESTFTRGIAAGVTLCILAVIPMFAAIAFSQPAGLHHHSHRIHPAASGRRWCLFHRAGQHHKWKLRHPATGRRIYTGRKTIQKENRSFYNRLLVYYHRHLSCMELPDERMG